HAGEEHGQPMLVARGDRLRVALGAPRLDDRGHPGRGGRVHVVAEWEERVGREHGALGAITGLANGDLHGVHAAHLPGADADDEGSLRSLTLPVRQDNRVALDVLADQPGKPEGLTLRLSWLTLGHHLPLVRVIGPDVAGLDQESAVHAAIVEPLRPTNKLT